MEELFVYLILFYEKIITYDLYQKKLDLLFIENPNNEVLLNLEWETDIEKIIVYIRTNVGYQNLNYEMFGKILMSKLKEYYNNCPDINIFANKMYSLWKNIPSYIQREEPFCMLSYADDSLAYGDEKQVRFLYEKMLNYYTNESINYNNF